MSTTGASGLAFRDAHPSEDDELARIMYNAFLPTWCHNWFQCIDEPIDPVPSTDSPLTPTQARRIAFYRSWIALNRMYNAAVTVAYVPATNGSAKDNTAYSNRNEHNVTYGSGSKDIPLPPPQVGQIAAVALLLPPGARPAWSDFGILLRSGFLSGVLGHGIRGFWRIVVTFHGNVETMIGRSLKKLGVAEGKEDRLLHVQAVVRNPDWRGDDGEGNEAKKGAARQLLVWGISRWRRDNDPHMPCWLDCFTDSAERSYRSIGFEVLDSVDVDTGCDRRGIKLGREATKEDRDEGRKAARQRVMLWTPEKDEAQNGK